jgi:putative intracellular protease/amidase
VLLLPSMASSKPQAPSPIRVGIVLFPGFEPLDAVGPANVFGAVEGIEISWIAEQQGPVSSKTGGCTTHVYKQCEKFESN